MITTGAVSIPPDHFIKRVRREYNDVRQALVREFIQNSVDAGASRIDLETGEDSLVVRDDGCGIKPERMVESLLTLGGTVKGEGSVGGFGLAKEVLLFCHEAFQIRTLNTLVRGQVLNYSMETVAEPVVGAEFSIRFNPEFGYTQGEFKGLARRYIASCDLDVAIYLDGERIACSSRARRTDMSFPHGVVYSRRLPAGSVSTSMTIRVRGLTMHEYHIAEIGKQVIVELEGDARTMLTSNRDGLRYPYSSELAKVAEAVAIDPKSFDRKKAQRAVFPGRDASFFARAEALVTDFFSGLIPQAEVATIVSSVRSALETGQPVAEALDGAIKTVSAGTGLALTRTDLLPLAELEQNFSTDFIVSIEGTDHRVAPKACRPATMCRSYREIAKLWKYLLDHCIAAAGLSLNYRIGFVLDPEKGGSFHRPDGLAAAEILVNPEKVSAIADRAERFTFLLVLAAHELAHHLTSYHNETFVHEEERILRAALTKLPSRGVAMREARAVTL